MSQSYGTSFLTSDTSSPSLVQVSTSALTSSNTLSNSATKSQTHIEKSTKTMSYSITCSSTFFILTYGQLFGLSTLVTTSVQSILHYTEQSFVTSYTYIPSQTSIETDTTTDSISYIPSITQIPTQSFTETNSMTLSPLLTPINTYVSLFDETIMMQRSLTYVLSNTIKETITLINTITLTNIEISNIISSTLTTIVPLTKTNEHQQIETYNSLLTISNSQTMIQTLSITFSSIIYSYTLFLFDSSYTHLMTEFIYYQYTIVRYVSYFSFFFSYGEQKEVETKKEIGIGIIIAIVAAVVIVVVIIVVALVLINRYMKNRITSSSCREEMAQEVNVNDWNETNEVNGVYEMKDIKEDPFAKDFEEQNFVYL